MNRKKYFDDPEGSSSYPQAAQFQRTWNKVLKFEESFGKTLDERSEERRVGKECRL